MSLRLKKSPAADALESIGRVVGRHGHRVSSGKLSAAVPHPVYTIAPADLVAGRSLDSACRLVGWRYLLVDRVSGKPVAAAELVGDTSETTGISVGPFVVTTDEAIEAAEKLPQVASQDFDVRMLRVAPLHLMALWLHSETVPADDLLLPVSPAPRGFSANNAYPVAQFTAMLTARAAKAIQTAKKS